MNVYEFKRDGKMLGTKRRTSDAEVEDKEYVTPTMKEHTGNTRPNTYGNNAGKEDAQTKGGEERAVTLSGGRQTKGMAPSEGKEVA